MIFLRLFSAMLMGVFLMVGASASANSIQVLSVTIKAQVSSDEVDASSLCTEHVSEGWVLEDEIEGICVWDKPVIVSDLPLHLSMGDLLISISRQGEVSLSMSVGDSDAGATAEGRLPVVNGAFAPGDAGFVLKGSGGDYASGLWSYNAEILVR